MRKNDRLALRKIERMVLVDNGWTGFIQITWLELIGICSVVEMLVAGINPS